MTQDEIIHMVYEAGGVRGEHTVLNNIWFELTADQLERFAALVAANEREACAKVCDMYSERWMFGETPVSEQTLSLMKRCAAAIRSRGDREK